MAGVPEDIDAAVAALRLVPGEPEQAALAAGLVRMLVRTGPNTAHYGIQYLDELLEMVDLDPPPQWPKLRAGARALSLLYSAAHGTLGDVDKALTEVAELKREAGDDPRVQGWLESSRVGLSYLRAIQHGDESAHRRMLDQMRQLFASLPAEHPGVAQIAEPIQQMTAMMAAQQHGNPAAMWQALDDLQTAADRLPPGHLFRTAVTEAAARMDLLRAHFDEGTGPGNGPTAEQMSALAGLPEGPGSFGIDRLLNPLTAGMAWLGGDKETNLERIDEGIGHFRQAVARATPEDPQRGFCLQSLALALLRRSEVSGTVAGLDEAVGLLEEARTLLGGPHHEQWSWANEMLAIIRDRLAQSPQATQSGLDGQRSYAWRALLEPDPDEARRAIQAAGREAVDLARRCVRDGRAADAISALDTGRGLILFAATERPRIANHLEAAGQADLARRWEAAWSGGADDELRRDVLTAVFGEAAFTTRLLDPPSLADIQSALATVDADALVYLVPSEQPLSGAAIIAPVDGAPRYVMLPHLAPQDEDVDRYLRALDNRNRGLLRDVGSERPSDEVAASLDRLCDWAWRAAIGPVLEQYVAGRPKPKTGRVPRLILIPMGDLARIPWQAARRSDGRYAVELAAFSQIASARMLCEVAARQPVAVSPVGLIVGDPDIDRPERDLYAARREAYAIRQSFYPGARYIGRWPDGTTSPSGAGTADQVRRWLADRDPWVGATLHLACHGAFRSAQEDASSYLMLAGGEELDAGELVALMTTADQRDIALVVLAACNSGRSVHGFDEAYSLGTAFLAGGARSVLSTQWSVPDADTSSLMYLFHYYLRREGLPPWEALREAQLRMVEPERGLPDGIPADLRPTPSAAGVVSWAGFVHWGQ